MTRFHTETGGLHLPTMHQTGNSICQLGRDEALVHIRKLLPLRHLSDPEFATITSSVRLENCAAGKEVFRSGQDNAFIFYLLSGTISITSADGESFDVASDGVESRYPISPHPQARIRATAQTSSQFVRLPADLMRLHREPECIGVTINEINDDDEALDNRVLFDIYHSLMEKDLVLPSLPDVAIKIRQVASNENVAVEDIARIIQADASTAAYCISIANNVAYAGAKHVDNVLDAVVRIGITKTRDLVVAYTIRSLFSGKDPHSKKLMRDAWKHSCRIAALSYILARDVGRLNPERALLAGLLHDIGVTVLINEIRNYPALKNNVIGFNRLCRDLSGQIGAMVLRAWSFPGVFANAALEAENFTKAVSDRLHLCDVVVLAHIHDQQAAPWSLETVGLSGLAITRKLHDYEMTEDCRLAVVKNADRELAELTMLLSR